MAMGFHNRTTGLTANNGMVLPGRAAVWTEHRIIKPRCYRHIHQVGDSFFRLLFVRRPLVLNR